MQPNGLESVGQDHPRDPAAQADTEQVPVGQSDRVAGAPIRGVVPMTFNTLSAWANGTANTYPLATLCAALGARTPTVAVPFAKQDLAGHPAWLASMAVPRYAGVTLVDPTTGAVGAIEPINSGGGKPLVPRSDGPGYSTAWIRASHCGRFEGHMRSGAVMPRRPRPWLSVRAVS